MIPARLKAWILVWTPLTWLILSLCTYPKDRTFSTGVGHVLAGFASSPHGFIVKSISVQMAGALAATSPEAPAPPPPSVPAVTPGRGGLQTVLNEQLLRVTLVVEVVKLLPQK